MKKPGGFRRVIRALRLQEEGRDLRGRLVALRDKIAADRTRDVQWYRSMEVHHMICDALDPPTNTDHRSAPPEKKESPDEN